MKKLKYGVIGTGGIAMGKHLPGYSAISDDVEIVAACDIRPEALEKAAKQFNIPYTFTNYKDLLAMKDIDFVSVCTPNYLHAPITIDALNAGKHVHCEKPMAMNAQEAKAMLDARDKTGNKLMIGLNNRFTPESQYVKNYIEEGNLGDIYLVKCGWLRRAGIATFGWFTDKTQSGGGPLIDLGVHFIDLVMYFMNYPALKSVTARTYSKFINTEDGYLYTYDKKKPAPGTKADVDDLAMGMIELENDATISFEISWASNIEKEYRFYDIYGTKAGIRFYDDGTENGVKIFTLLGGQHTDLKVNINPNVYNEKEFSHFINCIRENKQPTISIPEQAADMMKIIDSIYKSAGDKKQVVL